MKIGDMDGKGTVYDDKGQLILKAGESIVAEFPTTCKSWAAPYKRGPKKTHLQGIQGIHIKGRFVVTDKRLVFIGEPFHYHQGFDAIGIMGSSYGNFQYAMARSKVAHRDGGKMYVEYPLETIVDIDSSIFGTFIYARITKHRIFKMKFDRAAGGVLQNLIGERIKANK